MKVEGSGLLLATADVACLGCSTAEKGLSMKENTQSTLTTVFLVAALRLLNRTLSQLCKYQLNQRQDLLVKTVACYLSKKREEGKQIVNS